MKTEIDIALGQFSIVYHSFVGYLAPDEDVQRPVDPEQRAALYNREDRAWQPVQVELPRGLTEIARGAFEDCRGLTAVLIPDTIETIGDNAFTGCRALREIALPDSVAEIGKEAFSGCTSLTALHVPDSVKTIGDGAFAGCTGLQEIILPDSLSRQAKRILGDLEPICWKWFRGKLQVNPILAKTLAADMKRRRRDIVESLIRREDGETLDRYLALWDKVPLDILEEFLELAMHARKTEITALLMRYKNERYSQGQLDTAYQRQEEKKLGLRSRAIADWRKDFIFHEEDGGIVITGCKLTGPVMVVPAKIGKRPVTAIARWRPRGQRDRLEPYTVVLPEGLQEIRDEAFEYCRLREITIPNTVKVIGKRAFQVCRYLERIRIPPGVPCVAEQLFYECERLQSVEIPDSVTEVDPLAFYDCSSLKRVVFPANIRSAGGYYRNWSYVPQFIVPRGSVTAETFSRARLRYQYV